MHEFPFRPETNEAPETPTPPTPQPTAEPASLDSAPPSSSEATAATDFVGTATATDSAPPPIPTLHVDRRQEIFRVAGELYRQTPDWVMFFREVLGVDGIVRRMFPEADDLAAFEKTAEYEEIQLMLAKLREKTVIKTDDNEPTRVITVRLPKSLHESLRTEAHDRHTSMNKLCISKLLQVVDDEMVPSE